MQMLRGRWILCPGYSAVSDLLSHQRASSSRWSIACLLVQLLVEHEDEPASREWKPRSTFRCECVLCGIRCVEIPFARRPRTVSHSLVPVEASAEVERSRGECAAAATASTSSAAESTAAAVAAGKGKGEQKLEHDAQASRWGDDRRCGWALRSIRGTQGARGKSKRAAEERRVGAIHKRWTNRSARRREWPAQQRAMESGGGQERGAARQRKQPGQKRVQQEPERPGRRRGIGGRGGGRVLRDGDRCCSCCCYRGLLLQQVGTIAAPAASHSSGVGLGSKVVNRPVSSSVRCRSLCRCCRLRRPRSAPACP